MLDLVRSCCLVCCSASPPTSSGIVVAMLCFSLSQVGHNRSLLHVDWELRSLPVQSVCDQCCSSTGRVPWLVPPFKAFWLLVGFCPVLDFLEPRGRSIRFFVHRFLAASFCKMFLSIVVVMSFFFSQLLAQHSCHATCSQRCCVTSGASSRSLSGSASLPRQC